MSSIRLLVGTRKGAFILTSDGKRERWRVDGPHFAGWEYYHMKGSPVDSSPIGVGPRVADVQAFAGRGQCKIEAKGFGRLVRRGEEASAGGKLECGA